MNKRLSLSFLLSVLVGFSPLLIPVARASTDLRAEIRVATIHAGLAIEMHALPLVHLHLHHVINCLVGPHGRQFDPRAGNPCHGLGQGAIPDSRMSTPVVRSALHQALQDALAGERDMTLVQAHHRAIAARKSLLQAAHALRSHH
jgi:hypothetical protein